MGGCQVLAVASFEKWDPETTHAWASLQKKSVKLSHTKQLSAVPQKGPFLKMC
jgi:hypothetical protein